MMGAVLQRENAANNAFDMHVSWKEAKRADQ